MRRSAASMASMRTRDWRCGSSRCSSRIRSDSGCYCTDCELRTIISAATPRVAEALSNDPTEGDAPLCLEADAAVYLPAPQKTGSSGRSPPPSTPPKGHPSAPRPVEVTGTISGGAGAASQANRTRTIAGCTLSQQRNQQRMPLCKSTSKEPGLRRGGRRQATVRLRDLEGSLKSNVGQEIHATINADGVKASASFQDLNTDKDWSCASAVKDIERSPS